MKRFGWSLNFDIELNRSKEGGSFVDLPLKSYSFFFKTINFFVEEALSMEQGVGREHQNMQNIFIFQKVNLIKLIFIIVSKIKVEKVEEKKLFTNVSELNSRNAWTYIFIYFNSIFQPKLKKNHMI